MILPFRGKWPSIHETSFIAPSADVIGDVMIGERSSVWFQCVIRGDVHSIRIGNRTNIQDQSVLHVTRNVSALKIGDECTIGHRVTLHGCTIGNRVLVGMGAIVLDDSVIGDECLIGAGALVTKGTVVPPRSLVIGAPARVARELKPEEIAMLAKSAAGYVENSKEYQGNVPTVAWHGKNTSDLEDFQEDFRDELDDSPEKNSLGESKKDELSKTEE